MAEKDLRIGYGKSDYEIIAEEPVFEGFFKMHACYLRYKMFEGGWSKLFRREIFLRGDVAGIVVHIDQ